MVASLFRREFPIIAPATDAGEANALAERLRTRLAGTPIETDGGSLTVTASIGVAPASDVRVDAAALLAAADEALYEGKAAGRNRAIGAR